MLNRSLRIKIKNKEFLILLGVIFIYFLHRLTTYKLGLYMEEFRDANAHLMALNNKIPYKDFRLWIYGPFAFCVYPAIFKIFGVSIAVFRLSYIVISSLVIPLVYFLARRLMTPLWAGLSAFLSVLLIDVPYYTYNHILATIAGLFALLYVIKFTEKIRIYNLFFAGIFIGISFLVKPIFMGIAIFSSIFSFLLLVKMKNIFCTKLRLAHILTLVSGILLSLIPFVAYFMATGSLSDFASNVLPIGNDRPGGFYGFYTGVLPPLGEYWNSIMRILSFAAAASHGEWKTIFTQFHDGITLYAPVIFPLAIIFINKVVFRKYNLISKYAMMIFLLFSIYSILISAQSLFYLQQMGRSFTSQVPFLLFVYFLFLLNNKKIYEKARFLRLAAACLTFSFIFSLSFLHFFRYPYSRHKKYTQSLGLARAKDIKVTLLEKQLYGALNKFLHERTGIDEYIAVMGYFPQFSFLLERKNLFEDIGDVSLKIDSLIRTAGVNLADKAILSKTEGEVIARLESQKPKYLLMPIKFGREVFWGSVEGYINKNYIIEQTFGPAEIDINLEGIVRVYRLKT